MSTIIWFGKFKGHEMRVAHRGPGRWRWLLNNCDKWGDDLLDIERRYRLWQERHPKKKHGSRAAANIVHPMGAKLGLRDDELPSDYADDYSSDDGFVVKSSDEDEEEEEDQQEPSDEDDLDNDVDEVEIEDPEAEIEGDGTNEGSSKEGVSNLEDSDSSLPSVAEFLKLSSTTKLRSTESRRPKVLAAEISRRQREIPKNRDPHSDSETAVIAPPARNQCRRKRRRLIRPIVSYGDEGDDKNDSDISPPAKRRQNFTDKRMAEVSEISPEYHQP